MNLSKLFRVLLALLVSAAVGTLGTYWLTQWNNRTSVVAVPANKAKPSGWVPFNEDPNLGRAATTVTIHHGGNLTTQQITERLAELEARAITRHLR